MRIAAPAQLMHYKVIPQRARRERSQEPRDETDEIAKHGPVVRELTQKAIVKLNAMRAREGNSLFNELMKHVTLIASNLAEIEKRAPSVIEDYHKGMKTGLGIERLQFEHAERLEPAIALLSVIAALLLGLRHAARQEDAERTAAAAVVPLLWVRVLSVKLHGRPRDDLSVGEFLRGVARLGGHLGRKHDGPPGWLTLWRGWHDLQLMIQGAQLLRGGP